jgi:hypothetical protein
VQRREALAHRQPAIRLQAPPRRELEIAGGSLQMLLAWTTDCHILNDSHGFDAKGGLSAPPRSGTFAA